MNFKKILVLLIALIMVVGACAPAIYAFNYADVQEKGEQIVDDIQNAVDEIVDIVTSNDLQAYAEGYNYALENGYVATASDAVDNAINAIEGIDLSVVEIGDELKAALEEELAACVDTLGQLKAALDSEDVVFFVVSVVALVDGLDAHRENLQAIYDKGLNDVDVVEVINNVNNAFVEATNTIDATLNAANDYLVNVALPHYNHVADTLGIDFDVYEAIVRVVAKAHTSLVKAHKYVANVDNWSAIRGNFVELMHSYTVVASMIKNAYGDVKDALVVASQIYESVLDLVAQCKASVKNAIAKAYHVYEEIVDIVTVAYGVGVDTITTAKQVYGYIVNLFAKINEDVHNALYDAFNAYFVLNANSHYVAIGNAPYASELSGMVHLDDYDHFGFDEDFMGALKGADLVTIDFTDDDIYEFTFNQVMGTLSEIIRGNEKLMGWYYGEGKISEAIREFLVNHSFDIDAETTPLDWSLYLDAEGQASLDECLAQFKQKIIEKGIPEVYVLKLGDMIIEYLEAQGHYTKFLDIDLDVEIPVADLVVFAFENVLYKHTEFTNKVMDTLEAVNDNASNATVVITGLDQPFAELVYNLAGYGVDVEDVEVVTDALTSALDLQLLANAFTYDNVIFVQGNTADEIFNAIHFTCAHQFDECEDLECNLCGEVRDAVPHSFTKYVSNGDATCEKNGTETAVCDNCDATDTREEKNSKTDHTYSPATCTVAKTCTGCGKIEGTPAPHKYGEWTVVKDPTDITEGVRTHACTVCGHEEIDYIAPVQASISVAGIIGIIVLVLAVACGAVAGFCYFKRKKNA